MAMLDVLTILPLSLVCLMEVKASPVIWGDPDVLAHINVDCFNTSATLTYIGDPIIVLGFGKGKPCVFQDDPENARYILNAVFESTNEEDCVMWKRPHEKFYQIKLQARYTALDMEAEGDETVMLSCNFEPIQRSQAQTIKLRKPFSDPMIVVDDMGLEARSEFNLTIRRLDGSLIDGGVTVGTEVELIATMRPVPGESSFRVFLCYADLPGVEASIPIIVDGCGTGTPFPENQGFVRFGNLARSPTFHLFRAVKSRPVGFRCEFLVCKEKCDRYSCPTEVERTARHRLKRYLQKSARKWAHTKNVEVFLHGENHNIPASAADLVMAEDNETGINSSHGANQTWAIQSEHARFYVDEPSEPSDLSTLAPKFLILTCIGGVLGLVSVAVGIWIACRYKRSSATGTYDPPSSGTHEPSPSSSRNVTISSPIAISLPHSEHSDHYHELSL